MTPAVEAINELSPEDAARLFENAAARYLHMSGEEFLCAWDSGLYLPDPDKHPGVMRVASLIPLVR